MKIVREKPKSRRKTILVSFLGAMVIAGVAGVIAVVMNFSQVREEIPLLQPKADGEILPLTQGNVLLVSEREALTLQKNAADKTALEQRLQQVFESAEAFGCKGVVFPATVQGKALYNTSAAPAFFADTPLEKTDVPKLLLQEAQNRNMPLVLTLDVEQFPQLSQEQEGIGDLWNRLFSSEKKDASPAFAKTTPEHQALNAAKELSRKYPVSGVLVQNVKNQPEQFWSELEKVMSSKEQQWGIFDNGVCRFAHADTSWELQSVDVSAVTTSELDTFKQSNQSLLLEQVLFVRSKNAVKAAALQSRWTADDTAFTKVSLDNTPKTFAITRPTESITLDSSWETYFIAGTSTPGADVIDEDGAPVFSHPVTGLWGKQVSLQTGKNTFSFTQGEDTKTISITRNPAGKVTPIKTFKAGTLSPKASVPVPYGTALSLSCTAPYGSKVRASLGDVTVSLSPATSANAGTPVTFSGQMDISSLTKPDTVKNLGQVNYALTYNGAVKTGLSEGAVFAAGEGATLAGKVNSFAGTVNRNAANDGDYLTVLRQDCVVEVDGLSGGYLKLADGGYLLNGALEPLAESANLQNQVSAVTFRQTDTYEALVFEGALRPHFVGELSDDAFRFTMAKTILPPLPDITKSKIMSKIDVSSNDLGGAVLEMVRLPESTLWGWDVSFQDNQMTLKFKYPPTVNLQSAKPLSGVKILLDPGHGGKDVGAMGVPETSGPAENLFNLANAYVLQSRLEALGADVSLAQENTDSTLNNRLEIIQKTDADFFISIHHNSISALLDSNTVAGIEVYYWNNQSAAFAQAIGKNLSESRSQTLRFVEQSYYRVTMTEQCPAVLVESGYLSSPEEYSMLTTNEAVSSYADALTLSILEILANAGEM